MRTRTLWVRWVLANAAGEVVGLGAVAAVLAAGAATPWPPLIVLVGTVALGSLEGTAVGVAQWLAVRRALPRLEARAWTVATVLGALLAWLLGMLPSTLFALIGEPETSGAATELSPAAEAALAAALGAVAGAVLALFQWRALRPHVRRAARWLAANAAAWALGMPLVFAVAGHVFSAGVTVRGVAVALAGIAAIGALVGAVHGAVLVRLVREAVPPRLVVRAPIRGGTDELELERDTFPPHCPHPAAPRR
jgi:hypothetical protein